MKPLSKPLPGTRRGFEPFSLYNKKVQLLAVLSIMKLPLFRLFVIRFI
jgi:hypothetical protein